MTENEMLPNDSELYRRVYEVAHYLWDPIGISEHPEAYDEYNGYLTALFGRAKTEDVNAIVEYMKWAETENMGLSFHKEQAEKAAKVMVAWKRYIDENT
ncbi:MAG: hypothetical protein ACWA5R_14755 [bacterium]